MQGARRATGMQSPQQQGPQGLLQLTVQLKGIERRSVLPQLALHRRSDGLAGQEPVAGRLRLVVPSLHFGSVAVFAQQFGRGQKEVVQRFP